MEQDEKITPRIEHYELLYIIPMTYTSEELNPILIKVAKLITDLAGVMKKEEDLGKLKLAYTIKHMSHGYYHLCEFDMPKENLAKLNTNLGLENDVLRFLLTVKKIKTQLEIDKEKNLQEKLAKRKEEEIEKIKAEKKESKEKPKEKGGKEKISLEDLDKKLDEILDTDKF